MLRKQKLQLCHGKYFLCLWFLILCIFNLPCIAEQNTKNKPLINTSRYAPGVKSIINSHAYLQQNKAPLFWHISPFYISQLTSSSCSLASATMVMNAILSYRKLPVNEPLVTQDALLKRVNYIRWRNGVRENGIGATLDELKTYLRKALKRYGVNHFTIQVIHVNNTSEKYASLLHHDLVESEKTGKTLVIVNFNHKFFTDNADVGHFSPIGAYDNNTKRALIMDPAREFYEPYWVPEPLLLKSMATLDSQSDHYRGYIVIRLKE